MRGNSEIVEAKKSDTMKALMNAEKSRGKSLHQGNFNQN